MRVAVVIPTYLESDTIRQSVLSVLNQSSAEVSVIISDRSPLHQSLASVSDLIDDSKVIGLKSSTNSILENFYLPSEMALLKFGDYDAFAILAGDDWWAIDYLDACLNKWAATNADGILPRFAWASPEWSCLLPKLDVDYDSSTRRVLSAIVSGIETQPAHMIYALFGKSAFKALTQHLRRWEMQILFGEDTYASDLSIAFNLIADFRFSTSDGALIYRRLPERMDYAKIRLGVSPAPQDAPRIKVFARLFRIIYLEVSGCSSQLPGKWGSLPVRLPVMAWWLILSIRTLYFRRKKVQID